MLFAFKGSLVKHEFCLILINRIRYDRFFNVERTDLEELNNEMKNMMHFRVAHFLWHYS